MLHSEFFEFDKILALEATEYGAIRCVYKPKCFTEKIAITFNFCLVCFDFFKDKLKVT